VRPEESVRCWPRSKDNVKAFGFIQVVIMDQLHEKHRLNIPLTAFIRSDKDHSSASGQTIMINKSGN